MAAIDTFLHAVEAGTGIPPACYAEGATLDATVPNWRFGASGAAAIVAVYDGWFRHPARFEELDRRPTAGGEAVSYFLVWEEDGVPYAAHHCHLLSLAPDGTIARDRVWCGGRWSAALLAEMGAAVPAG